MKHIYLGNHPHPLRHPDTVMRLERLGAFQQTRISFVRTLMRKMMREQWRIDCTRFDLDAQGYGTCLYTIDATNNERYTLVLFSQFLDDSRRSDRVIADAWDVCFALCDGDVSEDDVEDLRANLPLQERGRYHPKTLIISRANKSARNFAHFVSTLASGQQPDPAKMERVGYLYRTTAVYGNGKFGIADYGKLQRTQTFAHPFSAQMFIVYMVRHFSIQQVNFLAQQQSPATAVLLDEAYGRYLGVGNATGLGMAPFLVHHPKLIHQWIAARETAISNAVYQGEITELHRQRFQMLIERAIIHVSEIYTDDALQQANNQRMHSDLQEAQAWLATHRHPLPNHETLWQSLVTRAYVYWSIETQEMLLSILIELYPDLVDSLEQGMSAVEDYDLVPDMLLTELKSVIERHYAWAIQIDFTTAQAQHFFWYRSAEKEEPRLGVRGVDEGHEKEQQIGIGRAVHACYQAICTTLAQCPAASPTINVAQFLFQAPQHNGIVRRIQSLSPYPYAEIHDNLLGDDCLPIHMLRCKLSIFGASKFDPKSSLWTRITLFQGAPLLSEIGQPFEDDWFLPTAPLLREGII